MQVKSWMIGKKSSRSKTMIRKRIRSKSRSKSKNEHAAVPSYS